MPPRLFLGVHDAGPPDNTLPGFYNDGSGSVTGIINISDRTVGSIAIYNGYTNRDDGTYTLLDDAANVLGSWTITTTSGDNSNDAADSFWLAFDPLVTTSSLTVSISANGGQSTVSFREIQVMAPVAAVPQPPYRRAA